MCNYIRSQYLKPITADTQTKKIMFSHTVFEKKIML